jgi:hypothetical protein
MAEKLFQVEGRINNSGGWILSSESNNDTDTYSASQTILQMNKGKESIRSERSHV